jgi:multiple sugar transport system substrate-binding protein
MSSFDSSEARPRSLSRRAVVGAAAGGVATALGLRAANAAPLSAPTLLRQETTEIRFWHQEVVPKRVEVFQKFIDAFNAENTDIRVVQESQGWDTAFSKLVSALTAGNPPDVMLSLPALTMTMQSRGDIIPVDSIVESVNSQHKFVESQLTPFKYQDATWGVPMWGMTFLLHYRTDLLEAAGVAEPPATWAEWLDASTKMTGNGKYGIILPANKNLFTTENFYSLMINTDARIYGPDGKIAFNSPETVEALTFYKDMVKAAAPPDAASLDWGTWEQALLRGIGASTNGFSSWRQAMDETDLKDLWGAVAQPAKEGGKPGQIHYPNNFMVFKQAEGKIEAITRFTEYMHQPEVNGEWLATMEPTLYLPITEASQKADSFWSHPVIAAHRPMVEKQLEVLPLGQLYGFEDPGAYNPTVGEFEGSGVLGEIVQRMVVEDLSPQEAADFGQTRIEEVLKLQ